MIPKITGSQRDFSSGEVDVALKRSDDHQARKTGLRQMSNMRILNSGAIQDRSGRSALFPATNYARIEEITMSPGNTFRIGFGNGIISFFDANGVRRVTIVAQGNGAPLPWTLANLNLIVYVAFRSAIYVTFPGMIPQVLNWSGTPSGWTISDYAEQVISGQKRTLFYRISPQYIALVPSGQTGNITLTAQVNDVGYDFFTPAHVGTRIRWVGRQILITGYLNAAQVSATVEEALPGAEDLGFSVDPRSTFSVGDVVVGSVTGSKGIVTSISSNYIRVQLISTNSSLVNVPYFQQQIQAFTIQDVVVGPGGGIQCNAASAIFDPSASVTLWDEEVMNPMRGYPQSVFVDQYRLGFCDFPSLPEGIAWSAINSPTDMYVGADPTNAIFETTPDKVRVYYVVPGVESSEFIFCDKKLYYIKIDASNPLKPGSVGFQTLSSDGCAQVQPRAAQEFLVYVNAGRNSIRAIEALGAYYRPFNVRGLTDYAAHLFSNIKALAIPTADGSFNERYIYALNGDNSVVVGKYTIDDNRLGTLIGWGAWPTNASILWVAANSAGVLFTSSYFGATICEALDDSKYLDASLAVNSLPAPFTPPAGKGPLWWMPGQTVTLMDQGTRPMGTYQIDANGFIVPQNNGGEDLTRADLIAGQQWTSIVEPFCPDANPGQSVHQRMLKRRISRFRAYTVQSTGFQLGRLFSGPISPTSPALGTLENSRRFPAYNQGDDPTLPPPLREASEFIRPLGRSLDPRVVLLKDTPGPLQVVELGVECSV